MSKLKHVHLDQVQDLVEIISDIFASAVLEKLKPELKILLQQTPQDMGVDPHPRFSNVVPNRNLWSLNEIAIDSGLSKSTWYKWVNQRKIPFIRLGRAVRIRDSDYRKFIQKSLQPEIKRKGIVEE